MQISQSSGFESSWDYTFLLLRSMFYYNSNPELISTITFHNECELRQDKQPGYDGYQTTEHPNVFEPENVLQPSGVDNSMFLSLPIHS